MILLELNFASFPIRFLKFSALTFNSLGSMTISEITIDPKQLNVNADKFENLVGDDAKFNASKIINIFKGEDNDFSKAVCLNAAAGLIVMEKYSNFKDSYENVRKFILSGKTYEHLKSLQNV